MLQKPRDALVFAAVIMVPAYFIADRADESSLVATPAVLDEEVAFTRPEPEAPEPIGEFDEDPLEVDDWYEESGIEDTQEEPEFVDEAAPAQPAREQSAARGFEGDVRATVARMDGR